MPDSIHRDVDDLAALLATRGGDVKNGCPSCVQRRGGLRQQCLNLLAAQPFQVVRRVQPEGRWCCSDACIRCPMLHVNPTMLARLDELETDLLDRRTRAETEGWVGEIEGIDMTLTFLRAKREDSQRRSRRPAVDLGLPKVVISE